MISYNKLASVLKERNMQWKDLCKGGLSINIPAKFSHDRTMNTENIDKVCEFLKIQPGDIMEWIPAEEYEKRKSTDLEKAQLESQIAELQAKLKTLQEGEE